MFDYEKAIRGNINNTNKQNNSQPQQPSSTSTGYYSYYQSAVGRPNQLLLQQPQQQQQQQTPLILQQCNSIPHFDNADIQFLYTSYQERETQLVDLQMIKNKYAMFTSFNSSEFRHFYFMFFEILMNTQKEERQRTTQEERIIEKYYRVHADLFNLKLMLCKLINEILSINKFHYQRHIQAGRQKEAQELLLFNSKFKLDIENLMKSQSYRLATIILYIAQYSRQHLMTEINQAEDFINSHQDLLKEIESFKSKLQKHQPKILKKSTQLSGLPADAQYVVAHATPTTITGGEPSTTSDCQSQQNQMQNHGQFAFPTSMGASSSTPTNANVNANSTNVNFNANLNTNANSKLQSYQQLLFNINENNYLKFQYFRYLQPKNDRYQTSNSAQTSSSNNHYYQQQQQLTQIQKENLINSMQIFNKGESSSYIENLDFKVSQNLFVPRPNNKSGKLGIEDIGADFDDNNENDIVSGGGGGVGGSGGSGGGRRSCSSAFDNQKLKNIIHMATQKQADLMIQSKAKYKMNAKSFQNSEPYQLEQQQNADNQLQQQSKNKKQSNNPMQQRELKEKLSVKNIEQKSLQRLASKKQLLFSEYNISNIQSRCSHYFKFSTPSTAITAPSSASCGQDQENLGVITDAPPPGLSTLQEMDIDPFYHLNLNKELNALADKFEKRNYIEKINQNLHKNNAYIHQQIKMYSQNQKMYQLKTKNRKDQLFAQSTKSQFKIQQHKYIRQTFTKQQSISHKQMVTAASNGAAAEELQVSAAVNYNGARSEKTNELQLQASSQFYNQTFQHINTSTSAEDRMTSNTTGSQSKYLHNLKQQQMKITSFSQTQNSTSNQESPQIFLNLRQFNLVKKENNYVNAKQINRGGGRNEDTAHVQLSNTSQQGIIPEQDMLNQYYITSQVISNNGGGNRQTNTHFHTSNEIANLNKEIHQLTMHQYQQQQKQISMMQNSKNIFDSYIEKSQQNIYINKMFINPQTMSPNLQKYEAFSKSKQRGQQQQQQQEVVN